MPTSLSLSTVLVTEKGKLSSYHGGLLIFFNALFLILNDFKVFKVIFSRKNFTVYPFYYLSGYLIKYLFMHLIPVSFVFMDIFIVT